MINEDYVSFEAAKLLKEKGFNEATYQFYEAITYPDDICLKTMDNIKYEPFYNSYYGIDLHGEDTGRYACPTLQMAMKWLREIHNIAINIGWGEVFEEDYRWWCIIIDQKSGEILQDSEYYKTYEEVVEEAIRYCLENLI